MNDFTRLMKKYIQEHSTVTNGYGETVKQYLSGDIELYDEE